MFFRKLKKKSNNNNILGEKYFLYDEKERNKGKSARFPKKKPELDHPPPHPSETK